MLFGEIDCREGLLLAVQKCKVGRMGLGPPPSCSDEEMGLGTAVPALQISFCTDLHARAALYMQYESLEEGIQATIDIYLSILLDLIRTRGMEVFVHPVPPVLKETRAIVKPFVAALQQAVSALCMEPINAHANCVESSPQSFSLLADHVGLGVVIMGDQWLPLLVPEQVTAAAATPAAQGRLHYLDFFSDLLLPGDQPALAPDLEFDGTHLAPAYVRYMAKQLAMIK
jgi:hypothetical protein